jgi:hypothetical protein
MDNMPTTSLAGKAMPSSVLWISAQISVVILPAAVRSLSNKMPK